MRGLRVQSFLGQNTLQPPQKQRHLVHRNTDDVSRDWPDHKVFFRTGGDIGQRVAHHARLSGKPSPISTRRRLFHVALAALKPYRPACPRQASWRAPAPSPAPSQAMRAGAAALLFFRFASIRLGVSGTSGAASWPPSVNPRSSNTRALILFCAARIAG